MVEIIEEKMPDRKRKGYSRSFYVQRVDADFFTALELYLKDMNYSISDFVTYACKYIVLGEGKDFFKDFKIYYEKVMDEKLNQTYIRHRGRVKRFEDAMNEFLTDSIIKI